MMTNNRVFVEREQRLEQVLVECLEELQTGRADSGAALVARYPEFAAEVADLVAGREKLGSVRGPAAGCHRTATGWPATRAAR
jgi:hypothetical protein